MKNLLNLRVETKTKRTGFLKKLIFSGLIFLFAAMPITQVFAADSNPSNSLSSPTTATNTDSSVNISPISATPSPSPSPTPVPDASNSDPIPSTLPHDHATPLHPFAPNFPTPPANASTPGVVSNSKPLGGSTAASFTATNGASTSVPSLYSTAQVAQPKIDQNTGALTYSYPITTPPGRNGMQPNLSLDYNSQNVGDGYIFGTGWNISIPYIERINRTGANNLYSQNYYTSSICGDLISSDNTNFGCRTENGDFLKFAYSSNTWTVTDKKGTTYLYGSSTATRLDDPNNSAHIYRWMLEKVTDTNNNYIKYSYSKNSGQIYPSQITYTGNGSTDGPFSISFSTQTRTDQYLSYKTGFAVTTNNRVNEIDIYISGILVHKYVLAYTTGDNGYRSLLSSITETGYDESGVGKTLPAVSFNYTTSTLSWTETQISNPPLAYDPNGLQNDYLLWNVSDNLAVVSADALPDIIESDAFNYNASTQTFGTTVNNIYVNNGENNNGNNTFTLSTGLNPPYQIQGQDQRGGWGGTFNEGVSFGDINGDLLPDIIKSQDPDHTYANDPTPGIYSVYLNTAGTSWVQNANWVPGIGITDRVDQRNGGTPTDYYTRVLDLNGDGLADIINVNQAGSAKVQLNTGTAFSSVSTTWTTQIPQIFYPRTRELDLNGDGIADWTFGGYSNGTFSPNALLGDGTGNYIQNSNFYPPLSLTTTSGCDLFAAYIDFNGDGLPDFTRDYRYSSSCGTYGSGTWGNYENTGNGWNQVSSILITTTWGGGQVGLAEIMTDWGFIPADINGDGLIDFVGGLNVTGQGHKTFAYIHDGVVPDLLSKITYPQGGNSTFTYKSSQQYRDSNSNLLNTKLPVVLQTVASMTTNDGLGNTATTNYSYSGGTYYYNSATDRKFAGFQKVVTTDPAGNVTNTYYHTQNGTDSTHGEYQDNYFKIGKPYRIENYNSSNSLYKVLINKWNSTGLSNGGGFVWLDTTVEKDYDGQASHNDKATAYTYDSTTGNTLTKVEYGQVTANDDGTFTDTGSDKYTTTYTYASGGSVVGLPDDISTVNQSSTKVKESKYYYDSSALGSVTKGNLTEQDDWISGTTYAASKKTYDGTYGLVTQSKDPNNNATNYSYDANNLYPTTITNALNQATQYTYNYQYGKVDQTTDVNNRVYKNTYDGLGRTVSVQQPDQTTPSTLVNETTYTYTDTSGVVAVQQNDWMDGSNSIATYTYYDGLNRKIQQRKSAEDGGNYNVKDFWYNNRGLLSQESLPYVSSGSSKTSPTSTSSLLIQYAYDPLQRLTTTTNTLGTTTNAYTPWKVTVTDANNHSKDLIKDAYDNLIQVNEYNGSTYTTTYSYDYLKDLTNITDALGNVRNFSYDGVGRRLTAQDLHPSSSGTFGTWNYTYDNAGNLTQVVDPNSNTINYVYDVLNRQTNEKLGSTNKVTYTYDAATGCSDGIGRLCSVSNPSVSTVYSYNGTGFVVKAVSTIAATPYETDYTYDRQQHQLTITNPDSSQVIYTYNLAGLPETVQRKESTDTTAKNVVTNFDYSPTEQATTISYANGATTTNTYDSTKLYRLTQKTTALGGSNIQNIAYVYDPVGNITSITDTSTTDTKKNISYGYDNLNRLTSYTVTSAVNGNNHSETYTYDAIGNITNKSDQGNYTYGGTGYPNPDAVTAENSISYTYDNNGNMLTAGSGMTNTWDYNNRLTQSTIGSTVVTYGYDQDGQRVKYSNGTNITYYPSKYYDITGTTQTKHIFANGAVIADITGTGSGAVAQYVNSDQLTGANVVTNDAGATKEVLDYYPFGASRLDEQTGYNDPKKFAGYFADADTSLNYVGARYYNPVVGRWLSEDAYVISPKVDLTDPQQLNAYSYVENNPIIHTDPTGNCIEDACIGEAIIAYSFLAANADLLTSLGIAGFFGISAAKDAVHTFNNPQANTSDKAYSLLNVAAVALTASPSNVSGDENINQGIAEEEAVTVKTPNQIGKEGEQRLANEVGPGEPHAYFKTDLGNRFIDLRVDDTIHEAKNGYITANKTISLQAQKDSWLQQTQGLEPVWHLYQGGSENAINLLQNSGIKVINYKK